MLDICGEVFRVKKPQEKIISQETKLLVSDRETMSFGKEFNEMRKKTNLSICSDIRKYELDKLKDAIDSVGSWRKAKDGIKNSTNWIPKLKDKTGIVKFNRDEIVEIATEFYENLYSSIE